MSELKKPGAGLRAATWINEIRAWAIGSSGATKDDIREYCDRALHALAAAPPPDLCLDASDALGLTGPEDWERRRMAAPPESSSMDYGNAEPPPDAPQGESRKGRAWYRIMDDMWSAWRSGERVDDYPELAAEIEFALGQRFDAAPPAQGKAQEAQNNGDHDVTVAGQSRDLAGVSRDAGDDGDTPMASALSGLPQDVVDELLAWFEYQDNRTSLHWWPSRRSIAFLRAAIIVGLPKDHPCDERDVVQPAQEAALTDALHRISIDCGVHAVSIAPTSAAAANWFSEIQRELQDFLASRRTGKESE